MDLNSLLYALEQTLARAYRLAGQPERAAQLGARAWERRLAMHRYLWDAKQGVYGDCLAGTPPDRSLKRGDALSALLRCRDTRAGPRGRGGRARPAPATGRPRHDTARTGEQWDAPNGWAPLQWIAIEGLNIHGHASLAREIALRWMRENVAVYRATGRPRREVRRQR